MADDTAAPIRVAFVHATGSKVPAWVPGLIKWLQEDPGFELVGRLPGEPLAQVKRPFLLAAERRALQLLRPHLFDDSLSAALTALPELGDQARWGKTCFADIAIALGACMLPDPVRDALVREEWSVALGGAPAHSADVSIMQAITSGQPTVPMTLLARGPGDTAARPVFTAQYNIKPSAVLTAESLEDQTLIFLQRALTCHRYDRPVNTGATAPLCPDAVPARARRTYAGHMVRALTGRIIEKATEKLNLARDGWRLHHGDGSGFDFDPAQFMSVPSASTIMADPFFLEHEGALYVFYEVLERRDQPAWIEVGRLDGDSFTPLGEALRCDYHLSFPFVFSDNGEVYMIPETHATNRLEVWRATRFPNEWELHATALEGQSPADSFLFRQDKTWWLFTNLSKVERLPDHMSALYLFKVDGPDLNEVKPHRLNPVIIGSDVARNAGCILSWRGALYRPSQLNARGVYGYGLNLMRIDQLDGETYHETLVKQITPTDLQGATGVHHISWATGKVIIDAYSE